MVEIGSGMDYKHLGEGDIPVYGTGGYMLSVDAALSEDKDAIGIGRKGTIDKPYILRAPFWTVDTLFYCIPKDGYDLDFTSCLFQNVDWKKKDESTGVPSLSKVIINNVETAAPSYEEQRKIGDYFKGIDNLITLHQRKCDETKSLKKYMLQKMFPKNGEQFPEIRFSGFTDAWEQRKLGEILEIVNNKNGDSYGKEDVLSVSDEYGCINQIRFQGRSFAGEDISNYKIVETGDIVYTRSPLKSKPYGIIKVVGDETGIVSPLYIVNKAKPGNDSEFIYRVFDSPEKTNTYLSPLVRKGAKNTMNVSNDEWLSGEIIVAPSFDEQQKIGEYFKQLDNLITLHQRE